MTPYETEIDAALKYARLPSEQIHPDLLLPFPSRQRLIATARDYFGDGVANEVTDLLPRYGLGDLEEHEVAPLRRFAEGRGMRAISNLLKRKPNHAGRVLQSLAFGTHDSPVSDLARVVLQNPHELTPVSVLRDELTDSGHPAADAIDWLNLGRGLGVEKLVRNSLASRNEHWMDLLNNSQYGLPRLAGMVQRDNRFGAGEDGRFPGLTDREIIDAAHRLHINQHETANRHTANWHRMAGFRTAGSIQRRAVESMRHHDAGWGTTAEDRVENAFKYRGPQPHESASE